MRETRNKKWIVRLSAFVVCLATAQASVELGIDVLVDHDYSLLAGKRVGLITNQTGNNAAGTRTRLLLKRHCKAQVKEDKSPRQIIEGRQPNEREFRRSRAQYLLY